jgi:fructosamine-3-kinase
MLNRQIRIFLKEIKNKKIITITDPACLFGKYECDLWGEAVSKLSKNKRATNFSLRFWY